MDFSTVDQTYRPPCYLFSSQLLLSQVPQYSRKRKLKKARAERLVSWQNWIELPSTTPLKTETNSYTFNSVARHFLLLSPLRRPLGVVRTLRERKRKRARGTEGAGELAYFYWHTQREPLRRRLCSA